MGDQILKVQTFQHFSVSCDPDIVLRGYFQSSKVILLLQYLLIHHKQGVAKDTLIDVLYSRKELDNPENALKLLVHRLRKLFILSGFPAAEYIQFSNGRYRWNNDVPCEIDFEQFDAALQAAEKPGLALAERLNHYKFALNLYKGDFLPYLAAEDWAVAFSVHYQDLFHACVRNMIQILKEQGDLHQVLDICSQAIEACPYSEEFQKIRIITLFELRHFKEAKAAYEQTVDTLYNELGVSPSKELTTLYKELSAELQDEVTSIDTIKEAIKEETTEKGAYFCNLPNFINSYHMMVRSFERTGQSCFLMLCTLEAQGSSASAAKAENNDAIERLRTAIMSTLRRGDIFTRYSKRQYLILLVGINQENCNLVMRRIEYKFRSTFKGKGWRLHYKVVSAADTDFMMTEDR